MMKLLFAIACILSVVFAVNVTNPTQQQLDATDTAVLQYALTLENLEANFYNFFQAKFSAADFTAANLSSTVYTYFDLIRLQENAHVSVLQSVLQARTGSTLANCTYNFASITTVTQYIAAARVLENVGTAAYDGAISFVYNQTLQQAAATIATVEGRHAAYLNTLPGIFNANTPFSYPGSPFPNATEIAFNASTVANYAMAFITSCPYNLTTVVSALSNEKVANVVPVAAPANQPANPSQYTVSSNDLVALNYALTLELLEATFYNRYLGTTGFAQSDFNTAGYATNTYTYFQMIQQHENLHVSFLQSAITSLGGTPVQNCTYVFPVTTLASFIQTASNLENAGVTAYDGAVNRVFNQDLRAAAATIATVEARHASFLNGLLNTSPFPNTFDNATAPNDIIAIVAGFITSCPTAPAGPALLRVYPYSNSSTTATTSTSGGTPTSASGTGTTSSSSVVAACAITTLLASVGALLM